MSLIGKYIRRKAFEKASLLSAGRSVSYCGRSSLKTVSVVADASACSRLPQAIEVLRGFFGCAIRVFIFDVSARRNDVPDAPEGSTVFTRKDLNFFRYPISDAYRKALSESSDVLVSLGASSLAAVSFFISSASRFKIGGGEVAPYSDLCINSQDGGEMECVDFAESVVRYLSAFKN